MNRVWGCSELARMEKLRNQILRPSVKYETETVPNAETRFLFPLLFEDGIDKGLLLEFCY